MIKVQKCSKNIYKKFSPYQKRLFKTLNYKFNLVEYWTGIFKNKITSKEAAKLAHNLAIVACWVIEEN